jgi:hypothetical protein
LECPSRFFCGGVRRYIHRASGNRSWPFSQPSNRPERSEARTLYDSFEIFGKEGTWIYIVGRCHVFRERVYTKTKRQETRTSILLSDQTIANIRHEESRLSYLRGSEVMQTASCTNKGTVISEALVPFGQAQWSQGVRSSRVQESQNPALIVAMEALIHSATPVTSDS